MIKTVVSLLEDFMSALVFLAAIALIGSIGYAGICQGFWAALAVFFIGSISLVFIFGLPCVLIEINNNIKILNSSYIELSKPNKSVENKANGNSEVNVEPERLTLNQIYGRER